MSVVFSIAVHEKQDCVIDMVENIRYFNESAKIVIHCCQGFSIKLPVRFSGDVFINKTSLYTGFMDGTLAYVHISNALFVKENKIKCSVFVPFGSNQLFVKQGFTKFALERKTITFPISYNQSLSLTDRVQTPRFLNDSAFNQLKFPNGIIKSAPEGTFYSYQLIENLISILEKNEIFNYRFQKVYKTRIGYEIRKFCRSLARIVYRLGLPVPKMLSAYSYASEEVLFPSLASCSKNVEHITCFTPWERGNIFVTVDDVNRVIKTRSNQFSVKRVARKIDDPVRKYIRSLMV